MVSNAFSAGAAASPEGSSLSQVRVCAAFELQKPLMDLPSRDTPESQIGLKPVMITTYRQAVDSRLDPEKAKATSMVLNQKRPSQNKRFFYW